MSKFHPVNKPENSVSSLKHNISDEEESESHSHVGKRSKATTTSAFSDKLQRILDKEKNPQLAASTLSDEGEESQFRQTAQYWVKRREPQLSKSKSKPLKDEDVVVKSEETLRAMKRCFALIEAASDLVKIYRLSGDLRKDVMINLKKDLQVKLRNLKKVDFLSDVLKRENACDMGLDNEYEDAFREKVLLPMIYDRTGEEEDPGKEAHAELKIIQMNTTQRAEAMVSLVNRTESRSRAREDDHEWRERKKQRIIMTWTRVVCLRHMLLQLEVKDRPDVINNWKNGDGFNQFKMDMRHKELGVKAALQRIIDELSDDERKTQEIRPWETQRDPEFRRILKKKFEDRFLGGRPAEAEPYASEEASTLEPRQVKKALAWFIDFNELVVYPSDCDTGTLKATILKDWKRVVALCVRVFEIRLAGRSRELKDPSDELHGDIANEAEKRIRFLAGRFKLFFLVHGQQRIDSALTSVTIEEKEKIVRMSRDNSEQVRTAFRNSYETYIELRQTD